MRRKKLEPRRQTYIFIVRELGQEKPKNEKKKNKQTTKNQLINEIKNDVVNVMAKFI